MTFEKTVIRKSFAPDLLAALMIAFYIFIPTKITSQLPMGKFVPLIGILVAMVLVMQFAIAPFIDHLIYHGLSERLEIFKSDEGDVQSRTKLFEDLMQMPVICALQTFLYYAVGSVVLFFLLKNLVHIQIQICILALIEALIGSVFSGLYGYSYCRAICTEYACLVVEKGIKTSYALKKKYFGVRMLRQFSLYIIIPFVFAILIQNLVMLSGLFDFSTSGFKVIFTKDVQIEHMALTCILNTIAEIVLSFVFFRNTFKNNEKLTLILEKMNQMDSNDIAHISTDLGDEIAYNHFLADNMLTLFQHTLKQFETAANQINEAAQSLYSISAETSTTSLEQSAGTKEIVETMKSTTLLAKQIEEKIIEVSELALSSSTEVNEGSQILKMYTEKMSEIERSNYLTIEGIKELNSRLNAVWEIVNIISSITDQTKLIAFNAELEATKISDTHSSFKNISIDVRRLANSTMDSTREIKERINEIQSASNTLIKAAQKCTEQIHLGLRMSEKLNNNFTNISYSSETNSSSAENIKNLIIEQSASFQQIETTLEQINYSIQDFTHSTQTLINTAKDLSVNSEELAKVTTNGESK